MMEGRIVDGRYVILEKVGAGGMADVYRARDNETGEEVAVKQMHADLLNDPEFVRRFEREAAAQSMLNHQNIVRTLGHGQDGDVPYIVMEYVEGITLKDFIKNRAPIEQKMLTRIARQILAALGHAHAHGVVHRDIKPQNVLMGRGNILKVTDFGLAKAASSATITMTGSNVLGSVHYFSPEQARGIASDARSDLYSLGIVLYEMATGVLPYQGDTPVTVALKHLQEVPYWPHLYADVPPALEGVILKAILKDPDQRYQSAAEMARDLALALENPQSQVVQFPENLYIAMDADEGEGLSPVPPREEPPQGGYAPQNGNGAQTPPVPPRENPPQQRYAAPRSRENPQPQQTQTGKKKKRDVRLIAIGVTIAVCLVMAVVLIVALVGKNRLTMPNLDGYTQSQVENALAEYEIAPQITYQYDDNVQSGRVISQDPAASAPIERKKTAVTVVISLGSEEVEMPALTGFSYERALELIEQYDLRISSVDYRVDSSKAKDTVVQQTPEAGQTIRRGEGVKLWLSRP